MVRKNFSNEYNTFCFDLNIKNIKLKDNHVQKITALKTHITQSSTFNTRIVVMKIKDIKFNPKAIL